MKTTLISIAMVIAVLLSYYLGTISGEIQAQQRYQKVIDSLTKAPDWYDTEQPR